MHLVSRRVATCPPRLLQDLFKPSARIDLRPETTPAGGGKLSGDEKLAALIASGMKHMLNGALTSAVKDFDCALTTDKESLNKLGADDVALTKYAFAKCLLLFGTPKDNEAAVKTLQELSDTFKQENFALAHYGLARALYQLNRFSEALTRVEHAWTAANHKKPYGVQTWPCTKNIIEETLPGELATLMSDLERLCRRPPPPDGSCKFNGCLEEGRNTRRHFYFTDAHHKGSVRCICSAQCCLDYHVSCWKKVRGEGRTDRDILRRACLTPDCPGLVTCIKVLEPDGQKKTQHAVNEDEQPPKPRTKHSSHTYLFPPSVTKLERAAVRKEKRMEWRKRRQEARQESLRQKAEDQVKGTQKIHNDTKADTRLAFDTIINKKPDGPPREETELNRQKKKKQQGVAKKSLGEFLASQPTHGADKLMSAVYTVLEQRAIDEVVQLGGGKYIVERDVLAKEKLTKSDQEVAESVYSYMHGVFTENGPLHSDHFTIKVHMTDFPPEALRLVHICGGVTKFLLMCMRFSCLDTLLCLTQDLVRAFHMLSVDFGSSDVLQGLMGAHLEGHHEAHLEAHLEGHHEGHLQGHVLLQNGNDQPPPVDLTSPFLLDQRLHEEPPYRRRSYSTDLMGSIDSYLAEPRRNSDDHNMAALRVDAQPFEPRPDINILKAQVYTLQQDKARLEAELRQHILHRNNRENEYSMLTKEKVALRDDVTRLQREMMNKRRSWEAERARLEQEKEAADFRRVKETDVTARKLEKVNQLEHDADQQRVAVNELEVALSMEKTATDQLKSKVFILEREVADLTSKYNQLKAADKVNREKHEEMKCRAITATVESLRTKLDWSLINYQAAINQLTNWLKNNEQMAAMSAPADLQQVKTALAQVKDSAEKCEVEFKQQIVDVTGAVPLEKLRHLTVASVPKVYLPPVPQAPQFNPAAQTVSRAPALRLPHPTTTTTTAASGPPQLGSAPQGPPQFSAPRQPVAPPQLRPLRQSGPPSLLTSAPGGPPGGPNVGVIGDSVTRGRGRGGAGRGDEQRAPGFTTNGHGGGSGDQQPKKRNKLNEAIHMLQRHVPGLSLEKCKSVLAKALNEMGAGQVTIEQIIEASVKIVRQEFPQQGVMEESAEYGECGICHDGIRFQAASAILTCDHNFHKLCIDKWSRSNGSCPICRTPF